MEMHVQVNKKWILTSRDVFKWSEMPSHIQIYLKLEEDALG